MAAKVVLQVRHPVGQGECGTGLNTNQVNKLDLQVHEAIRKPFYLHAKEVLKDTLYQNCQKSMTKKEFQSAWRRKDSNVQGTCIGLSADFQQKFYRPGKRRAYLMN